MSIVREVVLLLVETFWPRCVVCGRHGCRFRDLR